MPMGVPVRFGVLTPMGPQDLLGTLEPAAIGDARVYSAGFQVKRPGDHVFFVEPAPYWESAEGKLIVHYANAFGTQVIKADANGTFAYAMPRAGWWGFAALFEAPEPLPGPDGKPVPVEQGR
jgi:uncharacterized GH25 family protein